MTTILMYHVQTHDAFWVNTPEFANYITSQNPLYGVAEPGDPNYESIAALAGSSDFLA